MHFQLSNHNNVTTNNEIEDMNLITLPPGYRFNPNDIELIDYFLKQKLQGIHIVPPRIHDVDVYKFSPSELEKIYKFKGEDKMYFFTPRNKKYENGRRPDRAVENHGFWKATGKESAVMNNDVEIGFIRTLVFYNGKQGKAKELVNWKTNWIMQEFRIKDFTTSGATLYNNKDDWVLCKIYEHKYGMKCQIKSENNKKVTISTIATPQCQPIQHAKVQQMQDSMILYQPNQHFQDQALQDSLSADKSQSQSIQHSQAPQMPGFWLPNMTLQDQLNQHFWTQQAQELLSSKISLYQHFHAQQRQYSLSTDAIPVPQDQPNQHIETAMEEDYSDPCRYINFDDVEDYVNYFDKV